jgi:hypothetical protein
MTCVLRCRFFPLAQFFWELCPSVSVEVLMHDRGLDLTSGLLGRRNLATRLLAREICRPSPEEPFLADGSPCDNPRTERAQGSPPEAPLQLSISTQPLDLTSLK